MTTTPAATRTPIPPATLDNLRTELRALCRRLADEIVDADGTAGDSDPSGQRAATTLIAVAQAIALETVQLQRWLWDEAARRGVSVSAVARARGVTQQAQSKAQRR